MRLPGSAADRAPDGRFRWSYDEARAMASSAEPPMTFQLNPASSDPATLAERFIDHGCLMLESVFSRSFIAELHGAFVERYGSMTADEMESKCAEPGQNRFYQVGGHRYEIAPTMLPPFGDPRLYANGVILSLLDQLLG